MNNTFTENLKKFRLAKGLTQEQVADRLSINTQTVSRWECGTTLPDVLTLPELARLYAVTVDDFYKKSSAAYDNYAQRLAAVYEMTRDPEDFIRCLLEYKKLIREGKLSLEDKWNMAMLHQFMLAYCRDAAIAWYDIILVDGPGEGPQIYDRARSSRIKLFFLLGKGEEIIAEQSARAKAEPQNPRETAHLIEAYIFSCRFEDAYNCFKKATESFPNDWELYIHGGDVCKKLARYDEALLYYDKAGEIGTFFCDELYCKAALYEELGDYEKSCSLYTEISRTLHKRGYDVEAEMAENRAVELRGKIVRH